MELTEKQKQAIETVTDILDNMKCEPETSIYCDSCPWLRYCSWGDEPREDVKKKLNLLLKKGIDIYK